MFKKSATELEKTLLPWLGRTMKAMDYFLIEKFESIGLKITKAQMITLKVLSQHQGIPQNDLAFITNRDKASLTRLIGTMEKKNLVSRKVDKKDKRIKQVSITGHGQEVLNYAFPVLTEIMKEVQKGISSKEIETTISVLKKIGKNINVDALTVPLKD